MAQQQQQQEQQQQQQVIVNPAVFDIPPKTDRSQGFTEEVIREDVKALFRVMELGQRVRHLSCLVAERAAGLDKLWPSQGGDAVYHDGLPLGLMFNLDFDTDDVAVNIRKALFAYPAEVFAPFPLEEIDTSDCASVVGNRVVTHGDLVENVNSSAAAILNEYTFKPKCAKRQT